MKNFLFGLLVAAAFFTACQNEPKTAAPAAEVQTSVPAPDPTQCYENRLGQDLTAIELTLNGSDASGYMAWEPSEKDGARGSFKGTKTGDIITATFNYMIEGSVQAEEVLFKLADGKLLKGNGEMEDKAGVLVIKDKANVKWDEVFTNADCATLAEAIGSAKEISEAIKNQK
jgi:hypothetical protein